jgi:anti-sigma regulatory factor (Ser/Thr protein kinase)
MRAPCASDADHTEFLHEAFLYAGDDEFVNAIAAFARDAVAAGEPILVMVRARKIAALREALGTDAGHVGFADMGRIGANPGRIIPAWRDFVAAHAEAPRLRGVGEPIWRGRSPEALTEAQQHESLLNLAFAGAQQMWLVCPYDTDSLESPVIAEAHRTHPFVSCDRVGDRSVSGAYLGTVGCAPAAIQDELRPAPVDVPSFAFGLTDLHTVRGLVSGHAVASGLGRTRTDDLVVAVNEVATNSVRYGGGFGNLRLWRDVDDVVCEVSDEGRIHDPLVGRERPPTDRDGGAGLYLAHHFCDLVQLRSSEEGTVIRLRMRRP